MQVSQYLVFTVIPWMITSFVRGKRKGGVWPGVSGVCQSLPSGSGGWALRGIIPGSLADVSRRRVKSWKNKYIHQLTAQNYVGTFCQPNLYNYYFKQLLQLHFNDQIKAFVQTRWQPQTSLGWLYEPFSQFVA
jgi:hypothetical protein